VCVADEGTGPFRDAGTASDGLNAVWGHRTVQTLHSQVTYIDYCIYYWDHCT
jgi:hypothetical protein